MFDSMFEFLVLKTIAMSFLILVIVVSRVLVLKYLNAKVAYSLWLILPIYLLMPISVAEPHSSGGFMTFVLGANQDGLSGLSESAWFEFKVSHIGLLAWGIGFMVAVSLFAFRYWQLKSSLVERGLSELENNSLNTESVRVVSSHLIDTPAVFGLLHSYLVLPKHFSKHSIQDQQMILKHELFHLSRYDHRINLVRVLFKSLFWFNPLFHWADKYCEADQEISCDFGVLQNSNLNNRKAYATALLNSMTAAPQNKLLSQWQYKSLIKERVKMLKNNQSKHWHTGLGLLLAVAAVFGTSNIVVADATNVNNLDAIPTNIVQPRYPRSAAEKGIAGWVKFGLNVDSNGNPYEITLLESSPKGVFDKEAKKAIGKWKFEKNKSQKGLVYTMSFKLE